MKNNHIVGTALGLVLVFRTNGSSARLNEARVLLGNMVRVVRDLVRLLQYVPDDRRCEGVKKRLVGYAASVGKFFVILVRAIILTSSVLFITGFNPRRR